MYKSFNIKNFKCFKDFSIDNLDRINIIVGLNNAGKTALLEALFIHCGAYTLEIPMRLDSIRGIEYAKVTVAGWEEMPWNSMFNEFDLSQTIILDAQFEPVNQRKIEIKVVKEKEELFKISQMKKYKFAETSALYSSEAVQVLRLEYSENKRKGKQFLVFSSEGLEFYPVASPPPYPAFFLNDRTLKHSENAELFSKLEVTKQDILIKYLSIIEPRLKRLSLLHYNKFPLIHGDIGLKRLLPLALMGDGTVRMASLILHIANAPGGYVIIDEIENGIHHSNMIRVWNAIAAIAKDFNVQIFVSTHSFECIAAAHKAFAESSFDNYRLHRLERVDNIIKAITYEKNDLDSALELGLEVR